ncbi:DUF2828 family protein [Marinitoga aeolica]|uniref:DUF2828 family protein n=1 Tax=Marinitoga aeolica TaxID=2809031 RepID=A0ABY8PRC0_9BACT|nr:DUF2828 family protein [Marinitoga aeolica]WGS65162.1 DUF2828 family protein [Marinitoga aeolica]
MSREFIESLKLESNVSFTANGALSFKTSGSYVVDFFYFCGALMDDLKRFETMFFNAFNEDRLKAIRILFYSRDVRGGQGVRNTFRTILNRLGTFYPDIALKIAKYVPEYGRWDDLYAFVGTSIEAQVFKMMYNQLIEDIKNYKEGKEISLLAKWLKSENTSSAESRKLGKLTSKYFNMDSKTYRKVLSGLREHLRIVERDVSSNNWENIDYEIVPSQAMKRYRKSFLKHDEKRFLEYLEKVKEGKKKINASTLYPHQVVEMVMEKPDETAELLWKNLPKHEVKEDALVMADVSGSMYSGYPMPILVSISLAIYIAQRNKGKFKNTFLTFSQNPELQEIKGETLYENVVTLQNADWGMNTDIIKTFKLILDVAKKGNYTNEDLPKTIYIISDMQFDIAVEDNKMTNYEKIKQMYKGYGYEVPRIVFWNVSSYGRDVPVKDDEKGVMTLSGFNPVILDYIIEGKEFTPYDLVDIVINSERYNKINI